MTEKKSPIISFKNFSFQYRAQKKPTLKEINLDIYPGERVLIAGPSGCGKSTLAGCINGLNPFSNPGECSGELIVDGVDAPKSSIFQLSAHVGTVLQDPELIILDEPTAGQDFRHYTEIMDFLRGLNETGVTVVMITHDMHLMLEYTPRALVFADGRLIADRSAAAVLCDPQLIRLAALKETSLFTLANQLGISPAEEFVQRFIEEDREVRSHGR